MREAADSDLLYCVHLVYAGFLLVVMILAVVAVFIVVADALIGRIKIAIYGPPRFNHEKSKWDWSHLAKRPKM